MPKASKETASESMEVEGYEGHFERFEGGYTVGFETYTADADLSPFFDGLPNKGAAPLEGRAIRLLERVPGRRRVVDRDFRLG